MTVKSPLSLNTSTCGAVLYFSVIRIVKYKKDLSWILVHTGTCTKLDHFQEKEHDT